MVYKIWRQAHMWLAAFSALFLLVATVTGLILAVDMARNHLQGSVSQEAMRRPLSEVVSVLSDRYGEITSLEIRPGGVVVLEAFDDEGGDVRLMVDPKTGDSLGEPREPSDFIRGVTSLHRSLFLHDLGRIFVGGFTCLFLLVLLTGVVLLVKQLGLGRLFSQLGTSSLSSRLHLELGRWLIVPLVIVAATGSYSFMYRMGIIPQGTNQIELSEAPQETSGEMLPIADVAIFKSITLQDIRKIDFPLMEDEPYTLRLLDERLLISPISGMVLEREVYPFAAVAQRLSLDWHTGRTGLWWSIVLILTACAILLITVSGFIMLAKRLKAKPRRRREGVDVIESDILLLVGSERGSTWAIARYVSSLWQREGGRVVLIPLNEYTSAYRARHIVVFTCTYGEGEAPSSAERFESLIAADSVQHAMSFAVLAFGAKRYPAYCAYGIAVDQWLEGQPALDRLLPLHCVDNRSADDLASWATSWNEVSDYQLPSTRESYEYKHIKSVSLPQ